MRAGAPHGRTTRARPRRAALRPALARRGELGAHSSRRRSFATLAAILPQPHSLPPSGPAAALRRLRLGLLLLPEVWGEDSLPGRSAALTLASLPGSQMPRRFFSSCPSHSDPPRQRCLGPDPPRQPSRTRPGASPRACHSRAPGAFPSGVGKDKEPGARLTWRPLRAAQAAARCPPERETCGPRGWDAR